MVVEAHEARRRKRLRHEDRRGAVTAADVGHPAALLELGLDALERRDPRRDEVDGVPRPEEPLGPFEQPGIVLVPAHALAGPEGVGDPRLRLHGGLRQHERAGQVGVEEGDGLLFGEGELLAGALVGDVASGGHRREPFANVPLVGTRALRQVRGGGRPELAQRAEEPELVAGDHERGMEVCADVDHGAAEQRVELLLIDCHDGLLFWERVNGCGSSRHGQHQECHMATAWKC